MQNIKDIIDWDLGYKIVNVDTKLLRKVVVSRLNQLASLDIDPDQVENYHNLASEQDNKRLFKNFHYARWVSLDDSIASGLKKVLGGLDAVIKTSGMTVRTPTEVNNGTFMLVRPKPFDSYVVKLHSDRDAIGNDLNLWIPLSGFGKDYSLPIVPGSHLIDHKAKEGKRYNTLTYNEINVDRDPVRLDLAYGEALLFHSNLIHGNAVNEGNQTRLSLEVRFYLNDSDNKIAKSKDRIKEVIYVN